MFKNVFDNKEDVKLRLKHENSAYAKYFQDF